MAVRRPSPQEKQETADMEPVSDAHMMLIDRRSPRVPHTVRVGAYTRNTGPAGHYCEVTV